MIIDKSGKIRSPFIYFYDIAEYPRYFPEPDNLLHSEIDCFKNYIQKPQMGFTMQIQQDNIGILIIIWTIILTIAAFTAYYVFNGIESFLKEMYNKLIRK